MNEPLPGIAYPDLLHHTAACWLDASAADQALVFAFSGTGDGGVFTDALARASLAPSTWVPECFAEDLFLKDLVRACFQPAAGAGPQLLTAPLLRVLCAPPTDHQSVLLRQGILAELIEQPALRHAFEACHRVLTRFRAQLEGGTLIGGDDYARRQLSILRAFRDGITELANGFALARSGLRRVSNFAQRVRESEGFQSLEALLRYDEKLATVDFRVGIGADGHVRHLELVSVAEELGNPFVQSPLKRWLVKLELFLRGYRFGDGEVMTRLTDAVFEGVRSAWVPLVQLYRDLEFYLGALAFYDRAQRSGLPVCFPEFVPSSTPRTFLQLFNPLLLTHDVRPIGCNLHTDRHDVTLLITGPNSGGKTRLLQALGIAQLLGQSGLLVPAAQARLALCPGLVVSLIQETRVDQTEGRLGVELVRIRSLFELLPPGALVLLDELCSGTNPSEGEEIVELVIQSLTRLHPQAYITTHFLEFAARLSREQRIGDLRFLRVVLGPNLEATYQFAEGVATTSLASRAAARLGVTSEQLTALIDRKLEHLVKSGRVAAHELSAQGRPTDTPASS